MWVTIVQLYASFPVCICIYSRIEKSENDIENMSNKSIHKNV